MHKSFVSVCALSGGVGFVLSVSGATRPASALVETEADIHTCSRLPSRRRGILRCA